MQIQTYHSNQFQQWDRSLLTYVTNRIINTEVCYKQIYFEEKSFRFIQTSNEQFLFDKHQICHVNDFKISSTLTQQNPDELIQQLVHSLAYHRQSQRTKINTCESRVQKQNTGGNKNMLKLQHGPIHLELNFFNMKEMLARFWLFYSHD